jgi:hypothetical protein
MSVTARSDRSSMFTKPSERTIVGCQRLAISYSSSTVASSTADVSGNVRHAKPAPQASDHIALLARRSSAHRSGSQRAASVARHGDCRNARVARFWLKQNLPSDLELRRGMLNRSETQRI